MVSANTLLCTNTEVRHRRAHGPGAPDWPYCGSCTKKTCKISIYFVQFFFPNLLTNDCAHGILKVQRKRERYTQ